MNSIRFTFLLFFTTICSVTDGISAENMTAIPSGTVDVNTVDFTVYVWPTQGVMTGNSQVSGIPRTYMDLPHGPKHVNLHRATQSARYTYQGPSPLVLYFNKEIRSPIPENAPEGTVEEVRFQKVPYIRVELPEESKSLSLIVFPDQQNEDGTIRAVSLPSYNETLSDGDSTLINLTNETLILSENQETRPFTLNSQQTKIIPKEWTGKAPPRIRVYRTTDEGENEFLSTVRIRTQEYHQHMFCLFAKSTGGIRLLNVGSHLADGKEGNKK